MQVPSLQEYLNTKLLLIACVVSFQGYMYLHLLCSYIGSCKNLIVRYKVKRERKRQRNVQVFVIYFVKWCCFFPTASLLALFWIAVLWPQQLSMKLRISLLLKDTNDLLFFSEHKLYGFPQSEKTRERSEAVASACNFIKKRDFATGVFLWILWNF